MKTLCKQSSGHFLIFVGLLGEFLRNWREAGGRLGKALGSSKKLFFVERAFIFINFYEKPIVLTNFQYALGAFWLTLLCKRQRKTASRS